MVVVSIDFCECRFDESWGGWNYYVCVVDFVYGSSDEEVEDEFDVDVVIS